MRLVLVRRGSVCCVWAGSAGTRLPCGGTGPFLLVLLALDCRAVVLVRRGVCVSFLLVLLALDCRAVDIGFAVASVCVSFLRFC